MPATRCRAPAKPQAGQCAKGRWLLSIGVGISLLLGQGGGLYYLAFAVLLGIVLEVAAAWSLIVSPRQTNVTPGAQPAAEPPPGAPSAAGGGPLAQ